MFSYVVKFLTGRLILLTVPYMWPRSKGNALCEVGRIKFYGPKDFVEDCSEAINNVLLKHDKSLYDSLLRGNISLTFYCETRGRITFPSVGLYSIPPSVSRFKAEGICQEVVFRYIQSTEIGIGFQAAMQDSHQRHKRLLKVIRAKMVEWLKKTNYPSKWIECYIR